MTPNLILRGGRVIDPSQKIDSVMDVAFADGKVAALGSNLETNAGSEIRD
ncbi:MAG: amidohydrolase/deacetylase family metallohydrolase, partial [Hyphomicrobiales bacterium]|nr:amidohydrolase/deacetylase family metallohydrolase [Hyphomicrobiales bacterium]